VFLRHGLRQQGSSGGALERLGAGGEQQQRVHPGHGTAGEGDPGEPERGEGEQDLGSDDDAATIPAVGEMAGGHRERDDRKGLHQADPAERHRGAGALIDFPPERHGQHLASDRREQAAPEQQAAVAEAQRGIGVVGFHGRAQR
jgi:hypothetical protein